LNLSNERVISIRKMKVNISKMSQVILRSFDVSMFGEILLK
jgi:hypothetical protein